MVRYEGVEVILTAGDTITSKKGMLFHANLTGKDEYYYVTKAKYEGDGHWTALQKTTATDIQKIEDPKEASKAPPLYTRCDKCKGFFRADAGTPCPKKGCKGTMV